MKKLICSICVMIMMLFAQFDARSMNGYQALAGTTQAVLVAELQKTISEVVNKGDPEQIRSLLCAVNSHLESVLYNKLTYAVWGMADGSMAAIKAIVDEGADPTREGVLEGAAIRLENLEIVKYLVEEKGADPSKICERDWHRIKNPEIVTYLKSKLPAKP
ncbi:hypothetical protein FACS189449_12430 [Alphaproteobacteria bacterium]|nr:hypothetical protein FACS189449_12430 [Alphaproteobacteria bacterium]